MPNNLNENDFDLHENGREGGKHFHMNAFARRLVLKQRQKVTRKWPIEFVTIYDIFMHFYSFRDTSDRMLKF